MAPSLIVAALGASAFGGLVTSTLTYSLRDLSRVRLQSYLERRKLDRWTQPTLDHQQDLIFVTAVLRLLCNMAILLLSLELAERLGHGGAVVYVLAVLIATLVTMVCSIMLPNALARHLGDSIVAQLVRTLHAMYYVLWPIAKGMQVIDRLIGKAAGAGGSAETSERLDREIHEEIFSAIEEGEKEGVVGEEEREMIESVIRFRDTVAGQIMTPRPEMVGIESNLTLSQIKQTLETSGHSRIPVYEKTFDQILGVLYARDLLKQIGKPVEAFDIKSAMRPAFFIPETKPLRDLLHDFRQQKVHMAIVRDEYDGTAGLVTIEDLLEELVGDISDEHEPVEPAMFQRVNDSTVDVDARIYLDELNRLTGMELPEDAGYDTLGGFVSTTMGRIPEAGTRFDYEGASFVVLEAEPQRVNRVRIETLAEAPAADASAAST